MKPNGLWSTAEEELSRYHRFRFAEHGLRGTWGEGFVPTRTFEEKAAQMHDERDTPQFHDAVVSALRVEWVLDRLDRASRDDLRLTFEPRRVWAGREAPEAVTSKFRRAGANVSLLPLALVTAAVHRGHARHVRAKIDQWSKLREKIGFALAGKPPFPVDVAPSPTIADLVEFIEWEAAQNHHVVIEPIRAEANARLSAAMTAYCALIPEREAGLKSASDARRALRMAARLERLYAAA